MTLHPLFRNHREKYALDCGTTTYILAYIQFVIDIVNQHFHVIMNQMREQYCTKNLVLIRHDGLHCSYVLPVSQLQCHISCIGPEVI